MKTRWRVAIGIFVTVGLTALTAYYLTRPSILRLAVASNNAETARLMTAFANKMRHDNSNVRLRVTQRKNHDEVIKSMENGEVDLGIIRNEIAFPQNMSLIAVMQRNPIALIMPESKAVKSYTELKGKKIAVVTRSEQAVPVFERLLREYEVAPESVTILRVAAPDVLELAIKENIDGIFINGPPDALWVREAETSFTKLHDNKVKIVPIKEIEAISKRAPFLEPYELPVGAYGGNPPRPAESVRTASPALILIANNSTNEQVIGDFTEELFSAKASISIEHPAALRVQAPDVELNAAFPVHAGAYAHFNDTRQTLIERYGDYFYIGIMIISLIGTLVAAYFGIRKAQKKRHDQEAEEPLEELAALLRKVKTADSLSDLNTISESADMLLIHCLEEKENHANPSYVSLIVSTLERLRRSIDEKRRGLSVV